MDSTIVCTAPPSNSLENEMPAPPNKDWVKIVLLLLIAALLGANVLFAIRLFNNSSKPLSDADNSMVQNKFKDKEIAISSSILFSIRDPDSQEYFLYRTQAGSSKSMRVPIQGVDIEARKKAQEEAENKYFARGSENLDYDNIFHYTLSPRSYLSPNKEFVAIVYDDRLVYYETDDLFKSKILFTITEESVADPNYKKWSFDDVIWSSDSSKVGFTVMNESRASMTDEKFKDRVYVVDITSSKATLVKELVNADDEYYLWGLNSKADEFVVHRIPVFDPSKNMPRGNNTTVELISAIDFHTITKLNTIRVSSYLMHDRYFSEDYSYIVYDEGNGKVIRQNLKSGEKQSLFTHKDNFYVGSLLSPDANTLYGVKHAKGDSNDYQAISYNLATKEEKLLYYGHDTPYQGLNSISPSGKYIFVESWATAVKKKLRVYNIQNSEFGIFDPEVNDGPEGYSYDDIEFVGWLP